MNARLLIIGAALLWSTGGAAVKMAQLNAPQIAAGRAVIAAVVLLALLPEARLRWNRNILITAAFYAVTCILFVFANTLTTAGSTIFIQNTAPVWVLLFSARFLGEKATKAQLWSIPISLFGCSLFFFDALGESRLTGNLCAAAAVLFIRGIRGVPALEGALLILFEPVLSPLWAYLTVNEKMGTPALVGASLILGATVARVWSTRTQT